MHERTFLKTEVRNKETKKQNPKIPKSHNWEFMFLLSLCPIAAPPMLSEMESRS
jgi:hypothetical protein